MKIKTTILAALLMSESALAGGILTNTNQNINFLRNPARDGAIGIDGVYSNPAGVMFLGEGFHLSLNIQSAYQTRMVDTTNPLFAYGIHNNGATTKHYEGKATAPIVPSFQAAYNKGNWSFQAAFAVTGGGGKCEFKNGLGSFESAVAQIGAGLGSQYCAQYYMRGNQYYFGFTLGTAYKVNNNLSVYGGLRVLYGTAHYKAKISDILVKSDDVQMDFGNYLDIVNAKLTDGLTQLDPVKEVPGYAEQYQALLQKKEALEKLEVYRNGVNLQCNQTGWGVAPILGIDYKVGNFNFAAKYEFATQLSLKNESTLKEAMAIEAVNQFRDGTEVRDDAPALLTLGAQYSVMPELRVNAGYHLYFDKQSEKYGQKQELLAHNTMEYLAGAEYDLNSRLTVSAGMQITNYGMTDEYMSDLSFVTDSWSLGLGFKYHINEKVDINAGYFKTNYKHYKTALNEANIQNDFNRTNQVFGIGVDIHL